MLSSWEYSPSAVATIESLEWVRCWPLMGVGVGGVTGTVAIERYWPTGPLEQKHWSSRCSYIPWRRVGMAGPNRAVWAPLALFLAETLRLGRVYCRGFFTSSYCYLFPFKNVSFCIHQKWCVYVKLLPIHYFALICNTLLRVYLFISMRTMYEYNVGDMID